MKKKDKDYKDTLAEIGKEVYEDALKPAAKESAGLFSLVPRTIKACLAPLEKWVLNREYSVKETQKLLEFKLAKVSPDQIEAPEAYVAVPAINALSYSFGSDDLLDMYANLLASSMIRDKKWRVHPSFVEIIKQLSPDEARLMKAFSKAIGRNEFPLIDLTMSKEYADRIEIVYVIKHFTSVGEEQCDCFENISSYIENLARFGIIEIIEDEVVTGLDYSSLEKHPVIEKTREENDLRPGFKWIYNHYMFVVTNFGKIFISTCVNGPEDEEKKK